MPHRNVVFPPASTSRAAIGNGRFWVFTEVDRSFIELLAGALESDGATAPPDGPRGASCGELATVLDATARGLALAAHPVSKKDQAELVRLAVTRLCAPLR